VLWIGGATDTGKTTLARVLAGRHGLQTYHYDLHDLSQVQRLAQTHAGYRAFLAASLDDNWVQPEPEELLGRSLQAFEDRFPLVVEDLVALPREPLVLAEGFGLTPKLVAPALSSQRQAIWLVPTEQFKWASMQRRAKPSFKNEVSDPARATRNLLARDMLLAARVRTQAQARRLTVVEVDGSRSVEQMATLIEGHFARYL
jgi:hypothetical protein